MSKRWAYGIVGLAALVGGGCSSGGSSSSPSSGSSSSGGASNPDILDAGAMGSATVYYVAWRQNIAEENAGNGQQLSVKVGDSVVWVSTDGMQHNVDFTSGVPTIAASNFFTTQSQPITFTAAGTWLYQCDIHGSGSMKGTIKVQ